MSSLPTATASAAEALARIDSTLDQLYAAASIVIETVADFEALEAAPLHHRAAALTPIDRFIDRLEKRRAAEAPAPESENEEEDEKETWNNAYLMFTYGKYERPLAQHDPDDEVYMNLLRRSEALREADEALMAADAAAAAKSAANANPASAASRTPHVRAAPQTPHMKAVPSDAEFPAPRVSPDHVRAQITPYADPVPADSSGPTPHSPLSSLGWDTDASDESLSFATNNHPLSMSMERGLGGED